MSPSCRAALSLFASLASICAACGDESASTKCVEAPEVRSNILRILAGIRSVMEHSEIVHIDDLRLPVGQFFPSGSVVGGRRVEERVRPWRTLDVDLRFPTGRTEYRYGWVNAKARFTPPRPEGAVGGPLVMDVDAAVVAECDDGGTKHYYVWIDYWLSVQGWRVTRFQRGRFEERPLPLYDQPQHGVYGYD